MSDNNFSLKVDVSYMIEKFNQCSKDLNELTSQQNDKLHILLDKDNSNSEFRLMKISKRIRNLLKIGYVDGKERSEEYNIEGNRFYNGLQTKRKTERFRPDLEKSIFLEHARWHKIKVSEFVDELSLIKESTESSNNKQSDEKPLEFDVSHEDHTGKIKVFISHKFVESDQKLAETLQNSLNERGIYGYLAERKKEYDLGWDEKIKQDIESSDYLIAILTQNSLYAPSVHQEIGYAKGVRVPVRILAEGEEVKGVLAQGRDSEIFSRQDFGKYLDNIIKDVIKNGIRKKLTDKQKEELHENVYVPCYNQMMNVYERGEFIMVKPENPWETVSKALRLKTESDVKELFEEYTKELRIWNILFTERESEFTQNLHNILESVSYAFKHEKLSVNGSVQLDGSNTMAVYDWIREYRYVLFDSRIKNANQLHDRLLEFAQTTQNNHERWLNRFSEKTDLYRTLMKILPDIIKDNDIRICDGPMTLETQKIQEIVEKLIKLLEEKLKS